MHITLPEALSYLEQGEVIGIPTDTVYGLAVSIEDLHAIEKLYSLKKRAQTNPFVLQFPSVETIYPYLKETPKTFEQLAKMFWPGALTLVLPVKEKKIASVIRASQPTAAFRISSHPSFKQIAEQVYPLVITSANLSGKPPSLTWKEVEEQFGAHFPVIHCDENVSGVVSTLLSYQGKEKWKILRKGAIPEASLIEFI